MTDRKMFINRKYYENLFKEGVISLVEIMIIRERIYNFLRKIG